MTDKELLELVQKNIPKAWDGVDIKDILITGSRVYGHYRPRPVILNGVLLRASDYDVMVCSPTRDLHRFGNSKVSVRVGLDLVNIYLRRMAAVNQKFRGFLIPKRSLFSGKLFSWNYQEIQGYIEFRRAAHRTWDSYRQTNSGKSD